MTSTHRLGDSGGNVWSDEAGDGGEAVADAHQCAGVLRRDVHVVDKVAGVDEAAHAHRKNQQDHGQRRLRAVQVTQSDQEYAGTKHTCNEPNNSRSIDGTTEQKLCVQLDTDLVI